MVLRLGLLAALPCAALIRLTSSVDPLPLVGYVIFISLVTYLLYWRDKRKAQAGEWRIPESTLHLAELAGGWPSAYLAQRVLRHKISKLSYQIGFWLIVMFHQYLACDLLLEWRLIRGGLRLARETAL